MFITDLEADGRQTLDTVRVSIPGIVAEAFSLCTTFLGGGV